MTDADRQALRDSPVTPWMFHCDECGYWHIVRPLLAIAYARANALRLGDGTPDPTPCGQAAKE